MAGSEGREDSVRSQREGPRKDRRKVGTQTTSGECKPLVSVKRNIHSRVPRINWKCVTRSQQISHSHLTFRTQTNEITNDRAHKWRQNGNNEFGNLLSQTLALLLLP